MRQYLPNVLLGIQLLSGTGYAAKPEVETNDPGLLTCGVLTEIQDGRNRLITKDEEMEMDPGEVNLSVTWVLASTDKFLPLQTSSKVPFDIGPKPGKFNENVDDTAADNENGPAKPATGSTETKNSQKTLKMIGKIRTLSAEEMELENQKELELSGQDEYVEFGSDETENFKLRSGSDEPPVILVSLDGISAEDSQSSLTQQLPDSNAPGYYNQDAIDSANDEEITIDTQVELEIIDPDNNQNYLRYSCISPDMDVGTV